MANIFFLGATGHIGGAIVRATLIRSSHVQITALVRDKGRAERLETAFEGIQTVLGDLGDVDLIEAQSAASSIVINATPDWLPESPSAIQGALRGLSSRPNRGFYIQTSGAFLVGEKGNGNRESQTIWDDIEDIEQIINMPSDRYHQQTDHLVRSMSMGVHVAIVSPVVVYGMSPSPENQVPLTLRDIVDTAQRLSAGFTMSQGRNILGYVHVEDVADIYVRLIADAIKSGGASDSRLWGRQAYYFATGGELTFTQFMEMLVPALVERGVVSTDVIKRIGPESDRSDLQIVEETADVHGYGANVRCRSSRAETLLGWTPTSPSCGETLAEVVDCLLRNA
ncbi:nucleoside-diphosphate-sugar epimerase [Apiospora arundinis]|uniref:Nucleoside-diphosphate-sugar epimerase n=1 Tax=Apiospora arundinis TaxID=335852 RepID=A0ABR2HKT1_9PEZI